MWAAGGCDRDLALAEGADFGGRCGVCLFLDAEGSNFVDGLEQHKEHKGHDKEIDEGRNEIAAKACDVLQGVHFGTGDNVEDRVDEIIGERGHDAGEGAPDDDTDGHVHHVAAECKGFKFVDEILDLLVQNALPFSKNLAADGHAGYSSIFIGKIPRHDAQTLRRLVVLRYKPYCQLPRR